jgi:chorismate-pyruvate lyase
VIQPNPSAPDKSSDLVQGAYPLSEFYAHAKRPLPHIQFIPGEQVPEPFQALLVHHHDMTPTLEAFHQSDIHLEILTRERRGDFYFRQVVLRLNRNERPVEFGANKVYVGRFPVEARELILAEQIPLGRILKDCGVKHHTEAKAFLRVEADELIGSAFDLPAKTVLYGRKAVICDLQNRPLSEIVEILPPASIG